MNKKGETNPYLVSIAVPAGQVNWVNFDVPAINGALSYWNLMAYDYSGGWDKVAGDQANVYGGVTGTCAGQEQCGRIHQLIKLRRLQH